LPGTDTSSPDPSRVYAAFQARLTQEQWGEWLPEPGLKGAASVHWLSDGSYLHFAPQLRRNDAGSGNAPTPFMKNAVTQGSGQPIELQNVTIDNGVSISSPDGRVVGLVGAVGMMRET